MNTPAPLRPLCTSCGVCRPYSGADNGQCSFCNTRDRCPVCERYFRGKKLGSWCWICTAMMDLWDANMKAMGAGSARLKPEDLEYAIAHYSMLADAGKPLIPFVPADYYADASPEESVSGE